MPVWITFAFTINNGRFTVHCPVVHQEVAIRLEAKSGELKLRLMDGMRSKVTLHWPTK